MTRPALRVLLAGEGKTELGNAAAALAWRAEPIPGVLEILVSRVLERPVEVVHALEWKAIPKYRAGGCRGAETRTVLQLALMGLERMEAGEIDAVVFCRDRDGNPETQDNIEQGIDQAAELFPTARVAGGVAVEAIEAWVLVVHGDARAERYRDPKRRAGDAGIVSTADKVAILATCDRAALFARDDSLSRWCRRVDALAAEH